MPLILLALGAMLLCLALQAMTVVAAVRRIGTAANGERPRRPARAIFELVSQAMVILMLGTILQMAVWALLFRFGGAFDTFETAMYFSGVTFTSLGYGDVVLPQGVRFLAPVEAATGLMMFGITTAVLVAVIQDGLARRVKHRE